MRGETSSRNYKSSCFLKKHQDYHDLDDWESSLTSCLALLKRHTTTGAIAWEFFKKSCWLQKATALQSELQTTEVCPCQPYTMQFWNPSPGNLTAVHTSVHVKPATHMMTRGSDYPSVEGLIWATQIQGRALYPLPTTLRKILRKVKYLGLCTRNVELKKLLEWEAKRFQETTRSPVTFGETPRLTWPGWRSIFICSIQRGYI